MIVIFVYMNNTSNDIKPVIDRLIPLLVHMSMSELRLIKKIVSLPALDDSVPMYKQRKLINYLINLEQVLNYRIKQP